MSEKHYGIDYLNSTGEILTKIKSDSYGLFKHIETGNVLDLGCGTGLDVINMAKQLSPGVTVTGLDHDPVMINQALENASGRQMDGKVDFLVSEADQLPFAAGTVAGIRSERLIQHLKNPESVFDRIHEVLAPGAPLVILEADWTSLTFYNGALPLQQKLSRYLVDEKINNGYAARKMLAYLEHKGFSNLNITLLPFVFRSLKEIFTLLLIDQSLGEMKEKVLFSDSEYNEFKAALEAADAGQYFTCSMNLILVTGNK